MSVCDMQMRIAPLHYLPLPSSPRAMNAKCPTTETICPLRRWRMKASGLLIFMQGIHMVTSLKQVEVIRLFSWVTP